MLRPIYQLRGYSLEASDGSIGKAHDFYFDDESWTLRYVVDDTGGWFREHLILVPPAVLGSIDDDAQAFRTGITRQQVKELPDRREDPPVSKQPSRWDFGEIRAWPMMGYPMGTGYGVGAGAGVYGFGPISPIPMDRAEGTSPDRDREPNAPAAERFDVHLRSVKEVLGYTVSARDGELGHISDFHVSDGDWRIRYLEIDTNKWLPGRHVLFCPHWAHRFDFRERHVHVDLPLEKIKSAPEVSPHTPPTPEQEKALHVHYGQRCSWE